MKDAYSLEEIKNAFIRHFGGAGELWFPYVSEGNCTEAEELEAVTSEWEDFLEELSQPPTDKKA